jgi:hypothetical protein
MLLDKYFINMRKLFSLWCFVGILLPIVSFSQGDGLGYGGYDDEVRHMSGSVYYDIKDRLEYIIPQNMQQKWVLKFEQGRVLLSKRYPNKGDLANMLELLKPYGFYDCTPLRKTESEVLVGTADYVRDSSVDATLVRVGSRIGFSSRELFGFEWFCVKYLDNQRYKNRFLDGSPSQIFYFEDFPGWEFLALDINDSLTILEVRDRYTKKNAVRLPVGVPDYNSQAELIYHPQLGTFTSLSGETVCSGLANDKVLSMLGQLVYQR